VQLSTGAVHAVWRGHNSREINTERPGRTPSDTYPDGEAADVLHIVVPGVVVIVGAEVVAGGRRHSGIGAVEVSASQQRRSLVRQRHVPSSIVHLWVRTPIDCPATRPKCTCVYVFLASYGWDTIRCGVLQVNGSGAHQVVHRLVCTQASAMKCVYMSAPHVSKVILRPAFVASCSSAVRLTICAAQFQELVFATVYS
jgi:hypothetical protein